MLVIREIDQELFPDQMEGMEMSIEMEEMVVFKTEMEEVSKAEMVEDFKAMVEVIKEMEILETKTVGDKMVETLAGEEGVMVEVMEMKTNRTEAITQYEVEMEILDKNL